MRAALDTHTWNRGSKMVGKKRRYALAPTHRDPRRAGPGVTGSIEGKAARCEYPANGPVSRQQEKSAPPLSPTLFRYASQLRAQRRISTVTEGSKLDADEGSIFDADCEDVQSMPNAT
jgi:hypothetical protein